MSKIAMSRAIADQQDALAAIEAHVGEIEHDLARLKDAMNAAFETLTKRVDDLAVPMVAQPRDAVGGLSSEITDAETPQSAKRKSGRPRKYAPKDGQPEI